MALTVIALIAVGTGVFLCRGRVALSQSATQPPQKSDLARAKVCISQQSHEAIDSSDELNEAYQIHMARETYGYPRDIPVAEALSIINGQLQCYTLWAAQPPVTEEELFANAVAGRDYTEQYSAEKDRALKQIASSKMMPRGSLFTAESGGCQNGPRRREQTCSDGLKIYLFLGLDKNPRAAAPVKRDQIVLIRKTYFGVSSDYDEK
jgi:hypothetical protein